MPLVSTVNAGEKIFTCSRKQIGSVHHQTGFHFWLLNSDSESQAGDIIKCQELLRTSLISWRQKYWSGLHSCLFLKCHEQFFVTYLNALIRSRCLVSVCVLECEKRLKLGTHTTKITLICTTKGNSLCVQNADIYLLHFPDIYLPSSHRDGVACEERRG